jgi:ubiquinone/menaquinone biosynthesis C-methylase UbiE
MSIRSSIKKLFFPSKETNPQSGYDLWSVSYDNQPGNLMLALDEIIFTTLLNETSLAGKVIVDIGCGTGRHWKKIMDQKPERLTGYDVSTGMLEKLKEKFPLAETFVANTNDLPEQADHSCDIIVSTLTVAHIENIGEAFKEWNRILKPGGEMIITDYHPEALAKGGKRTFTHQGKVVAVKNHTHTIEQMRQLAKQLSLQEIRLIERRIDDSVKDYYEQQNALELFNRFKGVPVIYGIHLKKKDDPA